MEQHLNVLVQSSNQYAPFAGVMLTSLFENNKDMDHITVYLMTADMSEKNRGRFQTLAEQYQRTIKLINTNKIDNFLKDNQVPQYHGAYVPYYKIFALSVIEDELDRLIYLDSDMVILGSLSELMTCDLGNNALGMCIDAIPVKHKKAIKCDTQVYYNTGAIVFDVKKWREVGGMDKVIKHMTQVHGAYPIVDQDLMNIVFANQITTIPQKYNCVSTIFVYRDYNFLVRALGTENYYSEKEVVLTRENPTILHFLDLFGLRPWHKMEYPEYPNKAIWIKYLENSLWSDFSLLEHKIPIKNKVQYFLLKNAPKSIYIFISRTWCSIFAYWKAKESGLL